MSIERLTSRRIWGSRADDSGIGMILVLGLASAMMIVVALSVTVAINSLASSRRHVQYEAALSTAEAGIDQTLAKIQTANDAGQIYTSSAECSARWTWPSNSLPTATVERAWVEAVIDTMPDSCLIRNGQGEYMTFRALDVNGGALPVVYSRGWSPSRSAAEHGDRTVRAEYLFSPYKPSQAILTQGDLDFSGSVEVDLDADSLATSADVHSNGNVFAGNNSLIVNGSLSASGTNDKSGTCPNNKITGTCDGEAPPVAVPVVSARALYRGLASSTKSAWFDLCPDGTVRSPDSAGLQPCAGTVLSTSGTFRGWTLANSGTLQAVWKFAPVSGTEYPGAYYIYQADAELGGANKKATPAPISVVAEAKPNGDPNNALTCGKSGGNLTWKLSAISNYLPGVIFLADGTIYGEANDNISRGVVAAGDRVDFSTSSSTIIGSVLTSGNCPAAGGNVLQGVKVSYDSSTEFPLSTLVRTTQWLELSGN